jgi:hypothetical protein
MALMTGVDSAAWVFMNASMVRGKYRISHFGLRPSLPQESIRVSIYCIAGAIHSVSKPFLERGLPVLLHGRFYH